MSRDKNQTTNWKEKRRFHALKLKGKGWKQRDIATALDVTEGAVSRWLKTLDRKERMGCGLGLTRAGHLNSAL